MRLLLVTALDVWALAGQGGAPSLYRTLEAYGRRGHHVDVVSPTIGANHHFGEPPITPPALENVRFHQFHLPALSESRLTLPAGAAAADQKLRFALLFPWLASRRALKVARGDAPDLLYGYEVHGLLAQRLVRRRVRAPLVARFQGTIMHPYLDNPLQLLRRYEEVLALRTPADLYIMTNDGTRGDRVLAALNPRSAGKIRFWRNGLELEHVRPPSEEEAAAARWSLGIVRGDFVLVTASRLARWKRVDRAIDALAALRLRVPEARLLVVGDGEERAALEAQTRRLGLENAVTFTGAVPQSEVPRYLWAADVFLSVSELSNVGNPLLEAMTAQRCILTLDEGDTGELIADGLTGRLLGTASPDAIAAALEALARDPALRARLAAGARAYAEANFWSWEQRTAVEIEAVEALLGEKAAARA